MFPRTGLLGGASGEVAAVLARLSTEQRLDPSRVLFEQGDEGDALYSVLGGALEISVVSEDGRRFVLDVMAVGSLFGEIALFDPGPRTATATAIEPTHLLRVRNADLVREMRRSPELGIEMVRLCGRRMRWMSAQVGEQVFHPVPARLARRMLYLMASLQGGSGVLTLSQAQLADHVGTTREGVSRTLAEWRRAGLVEVSRRGVRVLDAGALEALALRDEDSGRR